MPKIPGRSNIVIFDKENSRNGVSGEAHANAYIA